MPKILLYLTALGVASLVVSGITKHEDDGVLGAVSTLSWGTFVCSALAVLVLSTATLVRRARS